MTCSWPFRGLRRATVRMIVLGLGWGSLSSAQEVRSVRRAPGVITALVTAAGKCWRRRSSAKALTTPIRVALRRRWVVLQRKIQREANHWISDPWKVSTSCAGFRRSKYCKKSRASRGALNTAGPFLHARCNEHRVHRMYQDTPNKQSAPPQSSSTISPARLRKSCRPKAQSSNPNMKTGANCGQWGSSPRTSMS